MSGVQDHQRSQRFETVVDAVGEPLRRYLARRTDPDTAEDVLAETLLVIWRRLDDVPPGAELPWSYSVARNCLANARRSARRQQGLVLRVARMTPRSAPGGEAPDGPDEAVHRALAGLRPDDRELLTLWAWEDLAPAELALVLGITPNAVHIRLHRARRRLATLLSAADSELIDAPGKADLPAGHTPVTERRTP